MVNQPPGAFHGSQDQTGLSPTCLMRQAQQVECLVLVLQQVKFLAYTILSFILTYNGLVDCMTIFTKLNYFLIGLLGEKVTSLVI